MEKKLIVSCSIILLILLVVSGCTSIQQKATETKKAKEINFQSDVLQLVNSSVDIQKNKGSIYNVVVTLYFKNLLNNKINVTYAVDFCDKSNNIIYNITYNLFNVFPNYRYTSPDVFSYDREKVGSFDHVNVYIVNYKIVG